MNINPSDLDVRQGYAPAETVTGTAPSAAVPQRKQDREDTPPVETDLRSQTAAAAADKTTALEAADKISRQLGETNTSLKIKLLDNTQDGVQVEIVDKKSDKVLRKIPQDELIRLAASIKNMSGVLLNHST